MKHKCIGTLWPRVFVTQHGSPVGTPTRLTLLTAGFQAPAFLVQRETLVARVTRGRVAGDAARRTRQTLAAFLVWIIECWTFRMARAFEFEVTRFAGYTLVGVRSGARFAFSVARTTPTHNYLQTRYTL